MGIVLDDPAADYDVQVDGATVATLVTPGKTTHWVNGLRDGVHTVRLVKRNDTPWATSAFGGFVAAPGGAVLARPTARGRQIEFVGDSLTAGYGNLSASRDCTGEQVARTTDADVSYGALAARRLRADYQINAYSGRGMVRNYNGGSPEENYRTFYDRALLNVSGRRLAEPGHLAAAARGGPPRHERLLDPAQPGRAVDGREPRRRVPQRLQRLPRRNCGTRYGTGTTLLAVGAGPFAGHVEQVVRERTDAGDRRVRYWSLDDTGLDYTGCHWHYSARDHRLLADRLTAFLADLPIRW